MPKNSILRRLAVLISILVGAAASFGQSCPGPVGPVQVLSGAIQVWDGNGGPFLTGTTYVVLGSVTIPTGKTLTIQPGAIVKVGISPGHSLTVRGTLTAIGTAANPIEVTSYLDDGIGGDTNGDCGATSPGAGDWSTILFSASTVGCVLEHCRFRYGGKNGPTIVIEQNGHIFKNCAIVDSGNHGLEFHAPAIPALVQNCDFSNCVKPIRGIPPIAVTTLVGNTGTGNSAGDAVFVDGTGASQATFTSGVTTWTPTNTLNGSGILVVNRAVGINSAATLVLDAGMIVKWSNVNCVMNVTGVMNCNGTAANPVVFTTLVDPFYGTAAVPSGAPAPMPGSWGSCNFGANSDASVLTHTIVRYGGNTSLGSISLSSSDMTLSNCTIEHSSAAGLSMTGSRPTVTGCAFNQNATRPIVQVAITAVAGFSSNTATGNGGGDVLSIGGGTLLQPLTLTTSGAFNGTGAYHLSNTITISSAATLTIEAGVVLKADPLSLPRIQIDGTLVTNGTAAAPVVFTSFRDDLSGGDQNGDGSATSAAAGDWEGLVFTGFSDSSMLSETRIKYAGTAALAAVRLTSSDLLMSHVVIDHCPGPGLSLAASYPSLIQCAFDDCGLPAPVVGVPMDALPGFVGCTAQNNVGPDALRIGTTTVAGAVVCSPTSTLNSTGVLIVDGSITIEASGSLTLTAGMVLKWSGAYQLHAKGPLDCQGTAAQPVCLTAVDDDLFGGDTLRDGPIPAAPGRWRKVLASNQSGSTISHTYVRFGGSASDPSIEASNDNLSLDHVHVEFGAGPGLRLDTTSQPTVTNCNFDHCVSPIDDASFAAVANFSSNTAQGNSLGDSIRIKNFGASVPLQVGPNQSLNGDGVFIMTATMSGIGDLELLPGTILKFAGPYSMGVNTRLSARGTSTTPVVFTSVNDADYGGPTIGGSSTAPAKGDWIGLSFAGPADASVIENAVIRWAGAGTVAAVRLMQADIALDKVEIRDCLGDAVDIGGNSSPTIVECRFLNNCGVAYGGLTWAALGRMRDNQIPGATGTLVMDNPVVDGHVVVNRWCYPGSCLIVPVTPNIVPPQATSVNSLSFGPGVVLKFTDGTVRMPLNQFSRIFGTGSAPVVMTSIHDDSVGGDANQNGAATLPAPGDWIGVVGYFLTSYPPPPLVEHLIVRWAGAPVSGVFGGSPSAGIQGRFAVMNSCRVDRSLGDGMYLGPGDFSNLVAFANGGAGISAGHYPCSDPTPQNCLSGATIRHATSTQNTGDGIFAQGPPPLPGSFLPSLRAWACNSWGNGGANYAGAAGMTIRSCNGSNVGPCPPTGTLGCFVSGQDNVNLDPLFVDATNGNLELQSGSPCLDVFPTAFDADPAMARDFYEGSRMVPSTAGGSQPGLSDLGAFERLPFTLATFGEPRIGSTVTLVVVGQSGTAALMMGFEDGIRLFSPYGFLLSGSPETSLLLGIVDVNDPYFLPLPPIAALDGFPFACQAWAAPSSSPAFGAFTNVYRGTIRP